MSLNMMHQLVYKMIIDQGAPHWISVNSIVDFLKRDVDSVLNALSDLVEEKYLELREFSNEIEVRLITNH